MGLIEVQAALARLYTEPALREHLITDVETAGTELALTPDEAKQLAAMVPAVKRFAHSLQSKRLSDTAHLLPSTRRELGPEFGRLFNEYSKGNPPPAGSRKPQQDAVRFAAFLMRRGLAEFSEPWIHDLVRYEATWVAAGGPRRFLRVTCFRWTVRHQAHGTNAGAPVKAWGLGLWFRTGPRARLRHAWLGQSYRPGIR